MITSWNWDKDNRILHPLTEDCNPQTFKPEPCPVCNGTGRNGRRKCAKCGGMREIWLPHVCGKCNGTGEIVFSGDYCDSMPRAFVLDNFPIRVVRWDNRQMSALETVFGAGLFSVSGMYNIGDKTDNELIEHAQTHLSNVQLIKLLADDDQRKNKDYNYKLGKELVILTGKEGYSLLCA